MVRHISSIETIKRIYKSLDVVLMVKDFGEFIWIYLLELRKVYDRLVFKIVFYQIRKVDIYLG